MSDTYEIIIDRLHGGESIEDIAKDLTDMLNQANKAYEDEVAQMAKDARMDDALDLAEMMNHYAQTYCDNFGMGDAVVFTAEDVDALFQSLAELMKSVRSLSTLLSSPASQEKKDSKSKSKELDVDKAIEDFLKMIK